MDPIAVTERFMEACTAGRRAEAQACCTEAAWSVSGESARRFFEQTTGGALTVRPSGPLRTHDDRATLPAFVDIDETQHLWVLLANPSGEWLVDGFADGWDTAGLYVHGRIERLPAFSELPASQAARSWFEAFEQGEELTSSPEGTSALELLQELRSTADSVRLVRSAEVAPAHRYAAAIAFEQSDGMTQTLWAILEGSGRGHLRVIARSFAASTSQLLRGVDPVWPPRGQTGEAPRYTAQEAVDLFQEALGAAHAERSAELGHDSPLGGRLGSVLGDLFESLLDPEHRPEHPTGTTAENRLAMDLSGALRDAAESTAIDDELDAKDLRIDSEFMRNNGGNLVSSLVSALTGALVPPDLSMDLGAPEGGSNKRVRIDLNDLLSGLVQPDDADDADDADDSDDDDAQA